MTRISVGDTLSRVFAIYKDQFVVLFLTALIVTLISSLVSAVLSGVLALLALIVSLVISALYTGMVVRLVQDVQDGRRDSSVGDLFASVGPVLLTLIIVSILAGIGIAIGFVLIIIPGLILLTIWSVVTPVVVVEDPGIMGAFGRSRELVRGNGWNVFGVIIVAFIIAIVFVAVAGAIGSAIAGGAGRFIFAWVLSALTAPISALVASVLYFRLRGDRGGEGEPVAADPPYPPTAEPAG